MEKVFENNFYRTVKTKLKMKCSNNFIVIIWCETNKKLGFSMVL